MQTRGEVPYVGKAKARVRYRYNIYKSKHRAFRKGNQKVPEKRFFMHTIVSMSTGELTNGIL